MIDGSTGKPMLKGPRTFTLSPFPEDVGDRLYFGGFDTSNFPTTDTAWIFRAAVKTVLSADP